MSLSSIALYCLRAGSFAAAVCAAYALFVHFRGRKLRLKSLLTIAYLAALLQITVLRGGVDWQNLAHGVRRVQLVPLYTTLEALGQGAWPLIYHVVGNLIWFLPLGMRMGGSGPALALLAGAITSAGIELGQLLLATGAMDIDDFLLNLLGTALGYLLARTLQRMRKA